MTKNYNIELLEQSTMARVYRHRLIYIDLENSILNNTKNSYKLLFSELIFQLLALKGLKTFVLITQCGLVKIKNLHRPVI